MSENIHPVKNNKAPLSSPMKDEPEDHMLLSSPHFRPAAEQNLTVDLKKAQQQQSSSQQYPSQIPGRKSLGRRVSFAATAHVRLYDKADSDREDEKGAGSEEDEDLDFRPAPKKGSLRGSPKPPSTHSPSGPSRPSRLSESFTPGGEDSAPSTPSVRIASNQNSSPSLHRFSTVTNYSTLNETGGRDSPNSIGSFDVDIKDVNSSSFTSYHSDGEDDETIELSQIGPRTDNDVDMEFTSCVGGILAKADSAKETGPESTKQPEEDNTMDFTVCVGGIIRRLPGIRLSDASCASSVDTMELTECVGKIIARQQGLPSTPVRAEEDMDMTMVVDKTIHCRDDIVGDERMGSPSPFLVATPAKALPTATGITFIGDVGEPDAFKLLDCVSPMPSQAVESMDHKIFHTFIDTDKCSDAPTPTHQQQPSGLPHNTQLTQSYDTLPSTLASAGQSLKASLSVLNTPKRPTSLLAQSSFAASNLSLPSQPEAVPTASLTDFLNETGIRFLENISSLKRRETTGRPRDSDIVAPSKQAFIASALIPQLDFFENAAEDLVPEIMGAKEVLGQQESQFGIQPPLAFLQYQRGDSATRQLVLAKLKTLKSVARLFSKQQWHQWRLQRQVALNKAMEENLEALLSAWDPLQSANAQVDTLISSSLEPQYRELHAELAALEHLRAFPDEIEQARQMEETVAAQTAQLEEMDAELAELERQEATLNRTISEAAAQKNQLSAKIEASKQALATTPKVTELLLNEMRSLLALRKAVCGWEFVHVRPDSLTIRYLLGGPVLIKLDFDATTKLVHAVSLSGNQAKLSIFRRSHRLETGTGKPIHETLAEIFAKLDSIAQIERQLATSALNMHCSFELLPDEADGLDGLDFKLCFFSYESRSKFDISLSISASNGNKLTYTGFTHHYGPIEEPDVRDYIGLALSSASSIEKSAAACKQIITSVQGLIAEHAVDGRPSDAFSLCLHSNEQLSEDPMVE